MNLGGDREHSGHKGYCLSAMVDILCAVLSGGNWGPTVDGLTVAGPAAARPKAAVGIGHFFGVMQARRPRPAAHWPASRAGRLPARGGVDSGR